MKKLGVVVPYRDRPHHLSTFRQKIGEYLKKNKIPFELIVVDQVDRKDFNRGKLLNIGFEKSIELGCDYIVFHDVDMIPISVDYSYSSQVTHLITKLNTPEGISRKLFDEYFGGVTLFPVDLFRQINGYSNKYEGWGFEDDDLLLRCKENFIELDSKEYIEKGKDSIGQQFNGETSFMSFTNKFKSGKDYTIFGSFEIDGIKTIKSQLSDVFSIFSIPGFDTTFSYNSFKHFFFQVWDVEGKPHSITSDHYPEGSYNFSVTIENLENKKVKVTLFINGETIGDLVIDKLHYISKPSQYHLGVGNPDRKTDNNYFYGNIDTFCIFNRVLEDKEIGYISNNKHFSFTERFPQELIHYYDMKYVIDNEVVDIMGRNNGYSFNTTSIRTYKSDSIEIPIPFRRNGEFEVLPHKENGYKTGHWVNYNSRKNQVKYYEKYYNNRSQYEQDGLTTLRFKQEGEMSVENYHHLQVRV